MSPPRSVRYPSTGLPSMAPAAYWPRTVTVCTSWGVMGLRARRTFSFSSRTELASRESGLSIAIRQRSCSMWFCTMSRSAPEVS